MKVLSEEMHHISDNLAVIQSGLVKELVSILDTAEQLVVVRKNTKLPK